MHNLLTLTSLNVNGFHSKINLGIIDDFLSKKHIILLTETLSDDLELKDSLLHDYKVLNLPRCKNYRYGGFLGISILLRNDIFDHTSIIKDTKSESILWLKINKELLGIEFALGAIYLPHEGSKYHSSDIFDNLQEDLLHIDANLNLPICLMGDCNARTGLTDDFLDVNEHVAELTGLDAASDYMCDMKYILNSKGICTERFNCDTLTNCNGDKLIECCKTFGIRIVNGRFGADKNIGKYTCYNKNNGKSVVDYALVSDTLLPIIADFEIDTFDKCLSDVHCPINLCFKTPDVVNYPENNIDDDLLNAKHANEENELNVGVEPSSSSISSTHLQFKWDKEKSKEFTKCFESLDLNNLKRDLLALEDSVSQANIDEFCRTLCDVFIDNAKEAKACIMVTNNQKHNGNQKKKVSKPWFDRECRNRRADYYKVKNQLKRIVGSEKELKSEGKKYSKFVKAKANKFHKDFNKKLRNLKSCNPKEYWSILNKSVEGKQAIAKISIESFAEHFRKLGETDNDDNNESAFKPQNIEHSINDELNKDFSVNEIQMLITKLKSGKACGIDLIRNEFLKNCPSEMIEIITLLFNIVLQSGIIPSDWCIGMIMPLFKNKGSHNDPDNYRGITLLSCIGKLFTAAINYRLTNYLEQTGSIGDEQAGFRAGYSTVDHIFTLHAILDIYLHKKERLYCAFVDYKKAFDLVDRTSLWMKLISHGINGRIVNAIYNLYSNAKSCVKYNGSISDSFACNVGVRQGENLSPMLFAIYLNDFELFVSSKYKGLEKISQEAHKYICDDDIEIFLKMYVLLYADDTIVMAETPDELHYALNAVYNYCSLWKLTVNTSKTKIVIFSRGKVRNVPTFLFGKDTLEVVDDYTYLGTTFNFNGNFKKAINKQIDAARRALFILKKKIMTLKLPIDLQLELFDKTILPILLYGAEVWGHSSHMILIEIFYRKFLKSILKVDSRTPDPMVYGETGKTKVELLVKERMICFWMRLLNGKQTKLSVLMYKIIKSMHDDPLNDYKSNWISYVKNIFDATGYSNIWFEAPCILTQNDSTSYVTWAKNAIHLRLNDIFKQEWNNQVYSNKLCNNYRIFKNVLELEPYLFNLSEKERVNMCKFRCRASNIPAATLNANNANEEMCTLCDMNECGDEFHYILRCPYFSAERNKLLKINNKKINCLQMRDIFTKKGIGKLKSLANFIGIIMSNFNPVKKTKKAQNELEYIPRPSTRSGRIPQRPNVLDL